jgi:hypothetical protein
MHDRGSRRATFVPLDAPAAVVDAIAVLAATRDSGAVRGKLTDEKGKLTGEKGKNTMA